jgi:hypothetical protein
MPKPVFPRTEAGEFARRLWEAMDAAGWEERGRMARWQHKLRVKQPTARGWVLGDFRPEPDKVRVMAAELGCDFDFLYFGPGRGVREPRPAYAGDLSPRALAFAQLFDALPEDDKRTLQKVGNALAEQDPGTGQELKTAHPSS